MLACGDCQFVIELCLDADDVPTEVLIEANGYSDYGRLSCRPEDSDPPEGGFEITRSVDATTGVPIPLQRITRYYDRIERRFFAELEWRRLVETPC